MAEGLSNTEIAERQQISEKTVRNHASNLFDTLGAWSRAQAMCSRVITASLRPPARRPLRFKSSEAVEFVALWERTRDFRLQYRERHAARLQHGIVKLLDRERRPALGLHPLA